MQQGAAADLKPQVMLRTARGRTLLLNHYVIHVFFFRLGYWDDERGKTEYNYCYRQAKHGEKDALVAMLQGTKARQLAHVFASLPDGTRPTVTEGTMDMAANRELAVSKPFPAPRL